MKLKSIAVGAFALSALLSTQASAQQCIPQPSAPAGEPRLCANAGSASLTSVAGSVMLARGGNLLAITADTVLVPGDRVVARGGSANLSLGSSCSTSIPANSSVTISGAGGQLCADQRSIVNPSAGLEAPAGVTGAPGFGSTVLPYAVGGAVLVGGAVALAVTRKDSSRLSP